MTQNCLMLLWHMHQPFYKDLVEGRYCMPWVRLHALKDYYGMVAILKEFPSVRLTFNLAPSLVVQLADYASGRARESGYEVAFKPVEKLTPEEKGALVAEAFQINRENLLNRYPRFRELYEKAQASSSLTAARKFAAQDLLDLQVLSQLAWFDEIFLASDAGVRALVSKGRGFNEDDKAFVYNKEQEILNAVLKEYRAASGRGQVELSTSPFYHPILPLLCESPVAEESHPGIKLPHRPFRHPEDARAQLRAAIELHERVFGHRPRGLWPSEGSISDEVLRLCAEEGLEWTASDEGVLGHSLQRDFHRHSDGTVVGGHELYRPHRFMAAERAISIFFRDHQLSDLIGFVYSRVDPHAAAADLHQRIRTAARSTGERPAVISVILDGENAWEFYPGNGREFLKAFYGRLADDPELRAVTASEAMGVTEAGTLSHVVPGSWINGNFDIWIGAEEDNRAWDLLGDARDFFAHNSTRAGLSPEEVKLAEQELWVAEGSDWYWWYGPEHASALDEEFDLLFRKHLSNIYRLLGGSPPDELALPIKRPKARGVSVPPTAPIAPVIDGRVTNYFEWLGAGSYAPDYPSGSMHSASQYLEACYFGSSDKAIYVRLDLTDAFLEVHPEFQIRVNFDDEGGARLHASVAPGRRCLVEFWRDETELSLKPGEQFEAAFGRIFELRLEHAMLKLGAHREIRFRVSLWASELPLEVIPPEGWITVEPGEGVW